MPQSQTCIQEESPVTHVDGEKWLVIQCSGPEYIYYIYIYCDRQDMY